MMWLVIAYVAVSVLALLSWAIVVTVGSTMAWCFDWLAFRQAEVRTRKVVGR